MNKNTIFKNVLATDSYMQVNCRLIQKLGIKEAIVLSELLSEQHHFESKDGLSNGFFYATYDFLKVDVNFTENQIRAAVKKLCDTKVDNVPVLQTKITYSYGEKIKWFKVNSRVVDELLKSYDGKGSVTDNTIRKDAFIIYNKMLARKTNPTAAVVFSDLLTTYYITETFGNLEADEWFKQVQDKQARRLGISRQILVTKYIPMLKDIGLIETKTMGNKNASYIRIMWNKLYEILGGVVLEEKEDGILVKKEESEVERITKKLLDHVKELSGLEWPFNYNKCSFIEQRLEEGLSEQDLYDVIKYKYDDYKRISGGKYYNRRFTWTNLFGSNCSKWISNMHEKVNKNVEYLKLEELSLRIIEEVKRLTKNRIEWKLDDRYYSLLKYQLDKGVSEDELVELVKNRYDWITSQTKPSWKSFSWNGLYGETDKYSCYKCITEMRKDKQKQTKSYDGVESTTYTKAEIEKFKQRAAEIEASGEQGVF